MTERIKPFLPAIILVLIVLGLVAWYMMRVPAPTPTFTDNTPAPGIPSEPKVIKEEAAYYTIEATYPQATKLRSIDMTTDSKAVAIMESFVTGQIAQFKKDGNFANLSHDDVQMMGLDQRKYALGIEYKTYESATTLSYVYQMYADTGGAHPNTYYHTFTFDKKTGAELSLKDVFVANAPYLQTLSSISRATLPGQIAAMESTTVAEVDTAYINSGTKPELEAFQSFYFEGKNLVILFPPYQVGPYVLGMITMPIATATLKDLKPEYAT